LIKRESVFTRKNRKKYCHSNKSILVYLSKILFVDDNLIDFDDDDNVEQGETDDGTVDKRVIVAGDE
jgi:hypothetical protein